MSTAITQWIEPTAIAAALASVSSTPHITSTQDRSNAILVVTIIMTVLATIFVAMRMISKAWVVRKVMWDDYITLLAWVFFVALATAVMVGARSGLGKVGLEIQPHWVGPLRRATYVFTVFYNPATMTIKLAILLLYRRMSEVQPWFRYGTYATMLIVSLAGTVCTFIAIFQCRPVHAAWTTSQDGEHGQCVDVIALFLSSAPVNILTDLSILLLPLPILTSLRMEMRQKVALIATFCVGGFVTVVDVVRIAYLQQALKAERIYGDSGQLSASTQFGDFEFNISISLMWSFIEISVGLMCSCTLVLKPLILRIMPAILRKARSGFTQQETHALNTVSNSPELDKSPQKASPPQQQQANREEIDLPVIRSQGGGDIQVVESVENTGNENEPRESEEGETFDFLAILKEDPPHLQNKGYLASKDTYLSPHMKQKQSTSDNGLLLSSREKAKKSSNLNRSASMNNGANTKTSYFHKLRQRRNSSSTKKSAAFVHHSQGPTAKFFDFVNMSGNKPLTELGAREALGPILFVSILFFLWGFSYGLIGNLNGQIEGLLGFQPHESLGLQSAYWAAYLCGPVGVGYWTITRKGFKVTFVAGLTIYSIGAMAFWPSAVLTSYPGFVISNFLAALGLSTLETAANPFIALAGPGELSESRLLFSQAIQAIGSLASGLLSQKVLFTNVDQMRLFKVQWVYLAVSIFVLILAAIFYYVPLSEATDEDLEIKANRRFEHAGIQAASKTFGLPTRWLLMVSGVFVISNYVSSQECISFAWNTFTEIIKPGSNPQNMKTIGQGLFFSSRVLASFACYIGVPPRFILGFCMFGAFLTALLPMVLPLGNGNLGTLILHMFFEGPIFPLIFAITLRGQGKHTKLTGTALVASISGASIFPVIEYKAEMLHRTNTNKQLLVLTIVCSLYGISFFFPLLTSFDKTLRRWIDPKWSIKQKGDKIAPDHGEDPHKIHYTRQTREDLGIQSNPNITVSNNNIGTTTQNSNMVGLGLNLNGADLNPVLSFNSIRNLRDFDPDIQDLSRNIIERDRQRSGV
ncbi:uncharacterized protein L201_003151 [Kwoniella dendrophila CBS 6074]|uniref:Rhodopsin domain-containing protein n=1 Tax=Kwoniella dendrophila CBS 6074 TaxID=1295534 RepID=A0AAX4JUL6_9TREE